MLPAELFTFFRTIRPRKRWHWVVASVLALLLVVGFLGSQRWFAKPDLRAQDPHFFDPETIAQDKAKMRAALKARGIDLLERPLLPDTSLGLASKAMQAAADQLPDGERGPAFGLPSASEIKLYCLRVGAFTGATDADARWALRILREHPDGGPRINAVGCLTNCLSDGYSWELERSLVSPNLRSEVLIELLTLVITTPKTELDSLLQRVVVNEFGTTCLWRIPAVRDAIEAYYAQHADNQEPLFLRLKEGTLQMMRSTPRGKAYGEK